jgi:hypothetical protein
LAARAQSARSARERRPAPQPYSAAAVSSGRIEVRSLAISPALQQMLAHDTVRIERTSEAEPEPSPEPPRDSLEDPEAHVVIRRFMRDIFVITVALGIALWASENWPIQHDDEEDNPKPEIGASASPPPPTEPMPPSAAERATAPAPPLTAVPILDAAAATAAEPAPAEVQKSGFVTISAAPWARITLDGRDAGVTPRRNLPVRAGKHALVLACPPLGREARVTLDVQAEQSVQVVVDLNETPARVSVK